MTLSVALALISLLLSLFTLLAVAGVYAKLRALEQSVHNSGGAAQLADQQRTVPEGLRPGNGETHTLALLLDVGCGVCLGLWESAARPIPGVRVVGVFSSDEVASSFDGPVEKLADPDLWTALYEGYTPCVYVITPEGRIADRRFVYGDTDVPALLSELLPALSDSWSPHAS